MSDERKQTMIVVSVKYTKEELARIERRARKNGKTRHREIKESSLAEEDQPIDAVSAPPTLKALQTLAGKFDERARVAPEAEAQRIEDCYQLLLQLRDAVMRAGGRRT